MLYLGNREPALDEVLDDPIVRLVMARDRLPPEEVRAHVEAVAARLGWRREPGLAELPHRYGRGTIVSV